MREKSQVEDIDRSIYDIRDEEKDAYRMEEGLTPQIVDKLSKEKGDPIWMQQFRLQSLQIYNEMPIPDWGPSIEGLDMDHIATYVRPNTKMQGSWDEVPEEIKTKRSAKLLALSAKMSKEFREYYLGSEQEVLFEEQGPVDGTPMYVGYTKEYVKVAVQSEEKLDNVMKTGKITAAIHDDLYLMD